jgi:hypothetical protein
MKHLGDYDASTVIYGKFTTFRPSTGSAFALGGTPALSVYKDNSTTQSTTGVTLTVDFDTVTGLNHFAIDTSADGTFYSAGSNFDIVITTGTVDGVSVVGSVVASFTIRKNSALKPATAGRTLVVDAAGLADANAVKLGPTGSGTAQTARDVGASVLLSAGSGTGQLDFTSGVVKANLAQILGTALTETAGQIAAAFKKFFNIATPAATMDHLILVDTVTTYTGNTLQTGDAYARLGAPAGASVSADVAAVKTDTAAIKTKTDFLPSATAGAAGGVFIAGTNAATSITTALTANVIGNITGNLSGSVGSVTGAVGSVTGNVGGNVTGSVGSVVGLTASNLDTTVSSRASAANLAIAQATLTKLDTTLEVATGSPGEYRFSADALVRAPTGSGGGGPSAADIADAVWDELLSGHVSAGSSGKIVGDSLDAAVSSRASQTSVNTVAGYVDTEVAAIKVVTDKLDTMFEPATGSPGEYRYSADALVRAPSGTGGGGSAPSAADIADAVWDELLSGHSGAGSSGKVVTDIKAKTDNLPSDPADASDIASSFSTVNGTLSTIAGYIDTEVAAIKAKTDNLPASPAATSDIPTAGAIADAVWDEALSGHTTSGTGGKAVLDTDLRGSRTVIRGTVSGTSPSTTSFTPSALSPAGVAADQFKGRIIIFDNDTATTALRGQATDITANTAASLPVLTYTALTTAPSSGDTFSIV